MNSEIEQRIVAMYFDNKDFEKNARQTINTLGELKNNLDLEDAAKGFDELDRAGKKLNLSQARSTINNFKDSIGGLQGVLKKAFDIGTAPIRSLNNFFNTFRGYVGKFVGFDLASKFVNSLETGLRQLTVAPIEQGWQMYQANVDSTKTIMSGTLKSYKEQMSKNNADWTYNEAEHMEYVKGQLKELSDYAQKTVFSLSDMTSNVGKFTNQNIDLETSVTAMEGIANMTAKAGQGAQQASMAMYNFSQALGVGKMTTIDWKSIENANLATTELKDLFIQTAAAGGQLEKVITEDATGKKLEQFFITVDKNGKKLAKNKWIEVSAENFRDSLSNGWLDKETMLRVMQLYSNQVTDLDTLASWGFDTHDEELMKYLFNIGDEAEKAATQVRTFAKMWDAMTESVQSGWADSMQYIFGDMLEATEFWTTVNEKIGSVLDGAAERRNNLLREWRGLTFNEETGEWERLEGAIDGREDLIQGIYETIDAAKDLGGAFSKAWEDVFGHLTGKRLQEITAGFRDFIGRFRKWLGDVNDADSRLGKIRSGLSGVFNVLKLVGKGVETIFGMAKKIVMPLIDPVLNLFDKFGKFMKLDGAKNLGEVLTLLRDKFSALWNKITSLGWSGIFSKIGGWLGNLWTEIRTGLSNFLTDNGLSGVVDWFVGIGDGLKGAFETVKTWLSESGIGELFSNLWDTVSGLFKPTEEGGEAPIVTFFSNTFNSIRTFFEDVKSWEIWKTIGSFFENVWNTLAGIFSPEKHSAMIGSERREWTTEAPIVAFFSNTFNSIRTFFEDVTSWPIWKTIGSFFEDVWNTLAGIFSPEKHSAMIGSERREWTTEAPIVTFFSNTFEGIKGFFEKVVNWPIWKNIGEFFSNIWDTLSGIFSPEKQSAMIGGERREWETEAPIVTFFKNAFEGVKEFFEKVRGWPIWNTIGTFFENVWNTLAGIFSPEKQSAMINGERREWTTDAPIVAFFKNAFEGVKEFFEKVKGWPIWNTIGTFFSNIWETLSGIFTPEKQSAMIGDERREWTTDAPIVKFFSNAFEGVKSFFKDVQGWEIWTTIGEFFSGVWDSVVGAFQPQKQSAMIGSERREWTTDAPIVAFFKQLWSDLQSVWEGITGWFERSGIKQFLVDAWDWVKTAAGGVIDWATKPVEDGKTGFVLFLEEFKAAVTSVWESIQNDIPWEEIGKFFGNIWDYIMGFFKGSEEVAESAGDVATEAGKTVQAAKKTEQPTEESVSLLERIIGTITEFVTKVLEKITGIVIPPEVQTFFNNIFDFLNGMMTFLGNILGTVGRVVGGKGTETDVWSVIIVAAVAGLAKIIDMITADKLANASKIESAATKFMAIGIGILAISAAISMLAGIDTGKMLVAAGVITVIGVVLAIIIKNINKTTNSMTALAEAKARPVTSTERVLNNLIDGLEKVGMIAVALALLPDIIKAFGEAKKLAPELKGDDILNTLLGITAMIAGVSAALAVLNKMTSGIGLDPVMAIKTGLAIAGFFGSLVTGFGIIGGAIGFGQTLSDKIQGAAPGSTAKSVEKSLGDAGDTIKSLMGMVRSFWEGLTGAQTDGEKIKSAQDILLEMANQLEVFTAEKTSGLIRVLNLIGLLSQTVQNTPDANKLGEFSNQLGPLADGIARFSWTMSGFTENSEMPEWNPENLATQIEQVNALFRAFSQVDGRFSGVHAEQFLNGIRTLNAEMSQEDFEAFGHVVSGIVQSFDKAIDVDSGPMASMADSLMTNLSKAVKLGLSDTGVDSIGSFDAEPVVQSIVDAIEKGDSAVATAVHNMIQNGIDSSTNAGENGSGYTFDMKNLGGLMSFINSPEELGGAMDMSAFTNMFYGEGGSADKPKEGSFMYELQNMESGLNQIEIPDVGSKLSDALSFKNPETGEDLDILGTLRETLGQVEEELNNAPEFEIKIVPTFDMKNLTAEALQAALGSRPILMPFGGQVNGGNMTIDFTGLAASLNLDGIRTQLSGIYDAIMAGQYNIVAAIDRMEGSIYNVSSAIAGIRLYLDTGALVGGITPLVDKALGQRANNARSTGVSPMLGNPFGNVFSPVTPAVHP